MTHKHITVVVPIRTWDELDTTANKTGRTLQALVAGILEEWATRPRLARRKARRSRQLPLQEGGGHG